MDEKSKREQVERYLRNEKKIVAREEQRRRRAASAARRQARPGGRRRRRDWDGADWDGADWDAADDDLAIFEKIKRAPARPSGGPHRTASELAALPSALVAGVHHGRVVLDDGVIARVAGHLLVDPLFQLAVGDEVMLSETDGPPRIEARAERRSCLSRPDPGNPHRALVLAANVDLAVIVVAAKDPPLRPGLIDRLLVAVGHGGVAAAVCVNKADLLHDAAERRGFRRVMAPYAALGCEVFWCSAEVGSGIDALGAHIAGRTCVFVGHSGVGKSSLLNALDPGGDRRTGAVRSRDGRGRHTTTGSSLRTLADGTRVIDTPGVRAFGLDVLDPAQVRAGFAEFEPFARRCRFADCSHRAEPGCEVRAAVDGGELPADRYASYRRILEDP